MVEVIKPDFGRTAQDYRQFRAGFPIELKAPLAAHGVGHPDQDVLDIGTGTGSLARLLAPHVRSVQGVDPSPQLLEQAAAIDAGAGVSVTYRVGTAEQTGLPSESVGVVTAGQCWHWFDADAAAVECARVLRPEGLIAIVHFDWIPLPGNVVEATEKLIERANPQWALGGGTGIYPRWLTDLARAGYRDIKTFSFDLDVSYTPQAWVGRIRASAGIGGSLPKDEVDRFSESLNDMVTSRFPGEHIAVPHRTWSVVARRGLKQAGDRGRKDIAAPERSW